MLEHSIQEGVCRLSSPMTPSQEEALEWLRYVGACHERGTPTLLGGRGEKVGGGATAEKAGVARINDRRRDAAAKEAPVVRYS